MGFTEDSPLAVTVDCGTAALPTLVKMNAILTAKGQSWQRLEQLPLEVDLPQRFAFHSVFACPVARDQSSPDNPPMILPCGCVRARRRGGCSPFLPAWPDNVPPWPQAGALPPVHPEAGPVQWAVIQVPLLPGASGTRLAGPSCVLLTPLARRLKCKPRPASQSSFEILQDDAAAVEVQPIAPHSIRVRR